MLNFVSLATPRIQTFVGPVHNHDGCVTSISRPKGIIPDCRGTTPPDQVKKTWDRDHDDTQFWKHARNERKFVGPGFRKW